MSRLYQVYDENHGESQRAIYVIDENGKIAWTYMSPLGVNPGADGILEALERIETSMKIPFTTLE